MANVKSKGRKTWLSKDQQKKNENKHKKKSFSSRKCLADSVKELIGRQSRTKRIKKNFKKEERNEKNNG